VDPQPIDRNEYYSISLFKNDGKIIIRNRNTRSEITSLQKNEVQGIETLLNLAMQRKNEDFFGKFQAA
jgi:hypothetical protein